MTVREVLAQGTALLKTSDTIETPGLDAALLLGEVLQTHRAGLIIAGFDSVSDAAQGKYGEALKRRLRGECVAYILGRKEFRGLEFTVNQDVLVPRPDTETLVEAALSYINRLPVSDPCPVLDMCTGSGAVGIALKHECPRISLSLSDISAPALRVAQDNVRRLLPGTVVHFMESDLFDRIEGRFTLITANPPYIPSGMLEGLAQEVKCEPRLSLDGGEDGLGIIRRLIPRAKDHLCPGGMLLMEADLRQMSFIRGILNDADYQEVRTFTDLAGRQRVIGGKYTSW